MDIMKVVNQAKDIIFNPKGTINKLKDEKITKQDLLFYLIIVGFPTFLGTLIGYGFVWGGTQLLGYAFLLAIITYILIIIGVIAFGYILNMLASSFKTKQNLMQAMKLVSYAATPWLLAGIFAIYPAISLISLLGGIYGLYILYIGIPILMGTPKEQQMPYFIIGIVVYIIVMGVIFFIVGWLWTQLLWSFVGGYYYPYGYRPPFYR